MQILGSGKILPIIIVSEASNPNISPVRSIESVGTTGGVLKEQGRNQRDLVNHAYSFHRCGATFHSKRPQSTATRSLRTLREVQSLGTRRHHAHRHRCLTHLDAGRYTKLPASRHRTCATVGHRESFDIVQSRRSPAFYRNLPAHGELLGHSSVGLHHHLHHVVGCRGQDLAGRGALSEPSWFMIEGIQVFGFRVGGPNLVIEGHCAL